MTEVYIVKADNMKIRLTKCYLVEIVDSEGNEIESEYVFADRTKSKEYGEEMKKELLRKQNEKEI